MDTIIDLLTDLFDTPSWICPLLAGVVTLVVAYVISSIELAGLGLLFLVLSAVFRIRRWY